MERISWNQYFMAQSHLLALRSTCTRLMVGATIVRDKRIIAGGYNGSISGGSHCEDEGCYLIDDRCARTIHAEINAILQCAKFGVPAEGSEIYVTHFPCLNCCKAIIQAGIRAVYYAEDYKNHPFALELFAEAGIHVEQVELEEMILDTNNQEKLAFAAKMLQKLEAHGAAENDLAELKNEANKLFTLSN
ncbi:ComE operon protein 2 [Salisediminibacterium halotolerans]|uniref:ComE operon protein 2 n=1 Tax=Salisediminibacterium halotolerans TaxID=517425 RepID=A0A1H9S4L1_9BACI|nr:MULTISPECIES: ComE operon protein 2 [Salisediminibacterium]RLJ78176.1 dCMP deaminase [Actinophytocola xinjiangensis]RPE88485.1 dCMP deaminase [Salisediminibacterium halotolerans]TWG37153.1 dCMP deaminase [Salisediminibacterium halotolerans]SER79962.1 dCMP deaminase [Salisediminibacterium haloalkalitolerans]GEL08631.1 ComE operon protein 2 [Salisediminibacterium halotolerans]